MYALFFALAWPMAVLRKHRFRTEVVAIGQALWVLLLITSFTRAVPFSVTKGTHVAAEIAYVVLVFMPMVVSGLVFVVAVVLLFFEGLYRFVTSF